MGKKNLYYFDEIRFLMILLIIVNHWAIDRSLLKTGMDDSLVHFYFELTSPTLAIISGYLFFYKTSERFDFVRKVKSRFSTLVIPFLLWCTFFFVVVNGFKLVYGYLFGENFWVHPTVRLTPMNYLDSLIHPVVVNFWYLQNLIVIIPICYLLYYMLKSRWVFLLLLAVVFVLFRDKNPALYFSFRFLPYYLVGCFLGYNNFQFPRIAWSPLAAILLVPVVLSISWLPYGSVWALVCRVGLVLLFLWLAYNVMESYKDAWPVRYLRENAEHSFLIFCSHIFILSLTEKAMLKLGLGLWLENRYYTLFFHLAALMVTVTVIIVCGRWLKGHYYRVYSVISGNRVKGESKQASELNGLIIG